MGTIVRCLAGTWHLPRAEPVPVYRWSSAMGEITDDLHTSTLSFALQSDTDGSNSSVELSSDLNHISIQEKSGEIKCRWVGCGLWFSHLDTLAVHVTRVHAMIGQKGLFYCGWEGCTRGDRGFNARYKMLVHVRTHTNEKPHHCYKCDKSFSRAENLKIHARSHTGERPYVCPIPGCGKAYSNSSDRFKHTRTHSVGKPYCCKVPGCPKRYTDPSSLRKHVKTYCHFPDAKEEDCTTKAVPDEDAAPYKRERLGSPVKDVMTLGESVHDLGRTACSTEWEKDASVVAGGDGCASPGARTVQQGVSAVVPLLPEETRYSLLQSWLQTDLTPHPLSLPWGLSVWASPWLHPSVLPVETHSVSSHSSDEEIMHAQDLPLDLTMHRASTVT